MRLFPPVGHQCGTGRRWASLAPPLPPRGDRVTERVATDPCSLSAARHRTESSVLELIVWVSPIRPSLGQLVPFPLFPVGPTTLSVLSSVAYALLSLSARRHRCV